MGGATHTRYSVVFAALLYSHRFSYGPLDVVSGLSRYISFLVVARPPRIPGHHLLISNIKVARDESIGGLEGLVRDRGPN
jgi:hypothetical protein